MCPCARYIHRNDSTYSSLYMSTSDCSLHRITSDIIPCTHTKILCTLRVCVCVHVHCARDACVCVHMLVCVCLCMCICPSVCVTAEPGPPLWDGLCSPDRRGHCPSGERGSDCHAQGLRLGLCQQEGVRERDSELYITICNVLVHNGCV